MEGHSRTDATRTRKKRYRSGLSGERVAAMALRLKGYRILEQRWKTNVSEIDLIAVRGHRLAIVGVKRRRSQPDAEAAITAALRRRVRRSADVWLGHNPKFQSHDIGFDLIFILPMRWPQHLINAL